MNLSDFGFPKFWILSSIWSTAYLELSLQDDSEGIRTTADEAFIDDAGVKRGYDSEDEMGGDPSRAPQAEEAEEDDGGVDALFGKGKRGRKSEGLPPHTSLWWRNCARVEWILQVVEESASKSILAVSLLYQLDRRTRASKEPKATEGTVSE